MFLHLCVFLFMGGDPSMQWAGGVHPLGIPPPEMATEAGGTHPNGMHSFFLQESSDQVEDLAMVTY